MSSVRLRRLLYHHESETRPLTQYRARNQPHSSPAEPKTQVEMGGRTLKWRSSTLNRHTLCQSRSRGPARRRPGSRPRGHPSRTLTRVSSLLSVSSGSDLAFVWSPALVSAGLKLLEFTFATLSSTRHSESLREMERNHFISDSLCPLLIRRHLHGIGPSVCLQCQTRHVGLTRLPEPPSAILSTI